MSTVQQEQRDARRELLRAVRQVIADEARGADGWEHGAMMFCWAVLQYLEAEQAQEAAER